MGDEFTLEGYLRQRTPNYVGNPLIEKLPKAAGLIDTTIREGYRDRNPVDPRIPGRKRNGR